MVKSNSKNKIIRVQLLNNAALTVIGCPGDCSTGVVCIWKALYGNVNVVVCWLLTSQQQASVSQGRTCSDNSTCYHTEAEGADQTFYLTQSQYTDTRPSSPSADAITPGVWQRSDWSANVLSHWCDSTRKKTPSPEGFEPGIFRSRGGRLNHLANEAVKMSMNLLQCDSFMCLYVLVLHT